MQDLYRQTWIGKLKHAMRVSEGSFAGVDKLRLDWAPDARGFIGQEILVKWKGKDPLRAQLDRLKTNQISCVAADLEGKNCRKVVLLPGTCLFFVVCVYG